MKIRKLDCKTAVASSNEIQADNTPVKACDVVDVNLDFSCGANSCKYESALNLISAAIESLAEIAKDDQIAKDSIANLGVIMLDLKGAC